MLFLKLGSMANTFIALATTGPLNSTMNFHTVDHDY